MGWVASFLTNRIQQVNIRGSTSRWEPVLSGIPQGSVLGPLLFVIYINDLPEDLKSNIYLFADDTKISKTINCANDQIILQSDIDKLTLWSKKWLLEFHPKKCKIMSLGRQSNANFSYFMTGNNQVHKIVRVENEPDLGVTFDPKLEFESHINNKINKANQIFSMIRRAYKFLDGRTFIPLYKSLVRCHLDYAVSVWSPHKQKFVDTIENVQRRATKQIPGYSALSYEERLKKLNLPTLTYRRLRGDMIEVFKILHELYDKNTTDFLKLRSDYVLREGGRGHDLKLFQQRAQKDVRKYSFTVRVVSTWNNLPNEVIGAPSLNAFKGRLDNHWKDQPLLYNYRSTLTRQKNDNKGKEDLTIEA